MKILVIEDEPDIAAVIAQGLAQSGYRVETAEDGADGLQRALDGHFGLIVLDLMLPGKDGWAVCRELRERRRTTPILMLTARDAVSDRVRGLETGADDYLPKPFHFDELRARVAALLRRDRVHKARRIHVADLEIDTGERRVVRAGQTIPLTPREYDLLEALAGHAGQTLSREAILERVWQDEDSVSNTVDVHIMSLRKKIDADHPMKLIQTVHRVGYRLAAPDGPTP